MSDLNRVFTSLERLQHRFEAASERYFGLNHMLVVDDGDQLGKLSGPPESRWRKDKPIVDGLMMYGG